MMMNKKLRDEALKYSNINNIIMHDWWIGIIATYFGSACFLDEPTILYRQHGDNSVGAVDTRSLRYVIEKLNQSKSIKKSLDETRTQAKEFVQTFHLGTDSLAYQYSQAFKMNKLERLLFYKKNGLKKSGLFRKIGLIVWG